MGKAISFRCLVATGLLGICAGSLSSARANVSDPEAALPGHYYLSGVREVGSELLLQPDGQFQWMIAYGAVDQTAQGQWSTDGRTVTLSASMAPAEDLAFRLSGKGEWNERAGHFLEHRLEHEAMLVRARDCPLPSLSRDEEIDISTFEYGDGAPSDRQIADARLMAEQAGQAAQAALDRLSAHPDWQNDELLVEETERALSGFLDRQAALRGIYDLAKKEGADPVALDLPPECRLRDWQKEAAVFRGVAVHVFDPDRYLRGDGVRVEAHYDSGPPVSDVVQQGYAYFPLPEGRHITVITLFAPGAGQGQGTDFPVTLDEPSVLIVDGDFGALETAPFWHMVLTIDADGSLAPEGAMSRGVYRKAMPAQQASGERE